MAKFDARRTATRNLHLDDLAVRPSTTSAGICVPLLSAKGRTQLLPASK